MRIHNVLAVVTYVMLSSMSGLAAELPLEVKGIPLEGREEDIFAKYPKPKADCFEMKANPFANRLCLTSDSFGGADARIRFSILNGKIRRIAVEIDSKDFEKVLEVLVEKYGTTKLKTSETVTNAMGAKFENVLVAWVFGTQRIFAQRFTDNIKTSSISYSVADDEQFKKKLEDDRKQRAKDL